MQLPAEQLQSNDRIDDDHKDDQQRNVQQRDHGAQNRVQHHLQTRHTGHKAQRTQHAERAQRLHVERVLHDAGQRGAHHSICI